MARQGWFFDDRAVQRIVSLLSTTDMTITEIAQRMSCSKSAVLSINRKKQIRSYEGHHSSWRLRETDVMVSEPAETVDISVHDDAN